MPSAVSGGRLAPTPRSSAHVPPCAAAPTRPLAVATRAPVLSASASVKAAPRSPAPVWQAQMDRAPSAPSAAPKLRSPAASSFDRLDATTRPAAKLTSPGRPCAITWIAPRFGLPLQRPRHLRDGRLGPRKHDCLDVWPETRQQRIEIRDGGVDEGDLVRVGHDDSRLVGSVGMLAWPANAAHVLKARRGAGAAWTGVDTRATPPTTIAGTRPRPPVLELTGLRAGRGLWASG